jgi:hypothetical protein
MNCMQPLSSDASDSASQALTCRSLGSSPKWVASWCQPAMCVWRARLLDEPRGGEHHNVGADHVLDGVEDRRVAYQLVRPAAQEVGARSILALARRQRSAERRADARLERLEIGSIASRRIRAKCGEGQGEAVAMIGGDLGLGQHLGHRLIPEARLAPSSHK